MIEDIFEFIKEIVGGVAEDVSVEDICDEDICDGIDFEGGEDFEGGRGDFEDNSDADYLDSKNYKDVFKEESSAVASPNNSQDFLRLCFVGTKENFDFNLNLNEEPLLFGRSNNADIAIPNEDRYMCISREHFNIFCREENILIENLKGEENPIFINGHRVTGKACIGSGIGYIFKIGDLTFQLKLRG